MRRLVSPICRSSACWRLRSAPIFPQRARCPALCTSRERCRSRKATWISIWRMRFCTKSPSIMCGRASTIGRRASIFPTSRSWRGGLAATGKVAPRGAATIRREGTRVLFQHLDGNLAAKSVALKGKQFGDLTLTANTTGGRLNFVLDSNLAQASIQGRGHAELSGDYPLNAELTFHNVTWSGLEPLLQSGGESPTFDAAAGGQVTLDGPGTKIANLRGWMKITRVGMNTIPAQGAGRPIAIQNQRPIAMSLDHGGVRIERLHLTGPETDFQAQGTGSIHGQALNITL